jgi:hypothetical protein
MTDKMERACTRRHPDVNARWHNEVQIVSTKFGQLVGDPHSLEVEYECLNCGRKLKIRLLPV